MKKQLLSSLVLVALGVLSTLAVAGQSAKPVVTAVKETRQTKMLYVLSAEKANVEEKAGQAYLMLQKPEITYFADRPVREAGVVTLKKFQNIWAKGRNSFAKDSPNAYVVGLNTSVDPKDSQVVQLGALSVHNGTLIFKIEQLNYPHTIQAGDLGQVTVFVDSFRSFFNGAGVPST